MEMGHSDLQDPLEHTPARGLGFMPKLFEAVVAGVPLASIEKPDGLPEAGIDHQAGFLRERLVRQRNSAAGRLFHRELPQPDRFGCHLEHLIGADVLKGPLQGHLHRGLKGVEFFSTG